MNLNGQTTLIGALAQHWNAVLLSFRGIAALGPGHGNQVCTFPGMFKTVTSRKFSGDG